MESADTSRKGNRKERAEDQIGKGKGKERAIDQTGKGKGKEHAKDQTGQNTGTLATVPTILGMSAKDAHDITQLPPSTASGIWSKASDLASDPQTIAKVPGGSTKDCFVLSKSNTLPHHVKGSSNAEYTCDDRCLHYKSISICSHTIAAAHSNGELREFCCGLVRGEGTRIPICSN